MPKKSQHDVSKREKDSDGWTNFDDVRPFRALNVCILAHSLALPLYYGEHRRCRRCLGA